MIEFNKPIDRFSTKSFSFEIDHKLEELEMESEYYTNNGFDIERHTFRISKEEAKKLCKYLSNWIE